MLDYPVGPGTARKVAARHITLDPLSDCVGEVKVVAGKYQCAECRRHVQTH